MIQDGAGVFPVESILEMFLLFDREGTIVYANAAAREKLEYGDELCGNHISSIFPNEFKKTEQGFFTEYVFDNQVHNLTAYRKNLTCFPVEARMIWEETQAGYLCMAYDILEKEFLSQEMERVKQEAQQALQVRSEFVANVTHELRTPVNGVLGNIMELMEQEEDDKKRRALQLIERCCGDMNKLINNILDFSKLEAGKFVLETRRFDFRNMIDYVRGNHQNRITEKGLDFFVTVSPEIPEYIVGDELKIVQILNNLLSNAQKFTHVGRISLEIIKTAQIKNTIELYFLVMDTGIGIKKEDFDKLFKSFSQVDASISRKYGGTGLGLNISRQFVEMMGGSIDVESEENKGTTFSFSIWVTDGDVEEKEGGLPEAMVHMKNRETPAAVLELKERNEAETEAFRKFGSPENKELFDKTMSKLVLCIEMENWEKAEGFMETIRQLTEEAPREVARCILRLKMAIQKANYDKAIKGLEELKICMEHEPEEGNQTDGL